MILKWHLAVPVPSLLETGGHVVWSTSTWKKDKPRRWCSLSIWSAGLWLTRPGHWRPIVTKTATYQPYRSYVVVTQNILSNSSLGATVLPVTAEISGPRLVTSGVAQGSALDLLLFLFYVDEGFDVIWHGIPFPLANDIKIVYTFPSKALESIICNKLQDLASHIFWAT